MEANHVTPLLSPLVTIDCWGIARRPYRGRGGTGYGPHAGLGQGPAAARISADFDPAYAQQMEGLLGIMIAEGMVTRYDEGPDVVYAIRTTRRRQLLSQHHHHFFVNKAIELALLKASETLARRQ